MLGKLHLLVAFVILLGCGLFAGCGGNTTVQPPPAESVPSDAPVGEESASTDEK